MQSLTGGMVCAELQACRTRVKEWALCQSCLDTLVPNVATHTFNFSKTANVTSLLSEHVKSVSLQKLSGTARVLSTTERRPLFEKSMLVLFLITDEDSDTKC